MSFDKFYPVMTEEHGRHATADSIASVPATPTKVIFDPANTVLGTLGTYDAPTQTWTFPSGIYRAQATLYFEHNSYPDLNETVTSTVSIGPSQLTFSTELNDTFPGRTKLTYERYFAVPAEMEFKTEVQADVAGRVQLLAPSESYVVKMWEYDNPIKETLQNILLF